MKCIELLINSYGESIEKNIPQENNFKKLLGGKIDWELGIDTYTLLYLKEITNKDLLYSTGNSAQYSVTI